MTKIAWFQCFSGIAGDMALGALIDAGAPLAEVERACRGLGVSGWTIRAERVRRAGLMGTHVLVEVADQAHPHRPASDVLRLVAEADLPERVRQRALATFRQLAEVEGLLHGMAPEDVEFHEVGAVDSIVDVVGVCVALELLGIDEVAASAVAQGTGTVRAAHGVLPNPPPAVVKLLAGVGAPVFGVDVAMELTTPTGAAILAANVARWGALPAMTVLGDGFGAGTRDFPNRANLVQVVIGNAATVESTHRQEASADAVVIETTLDDVTGEVLGYTTALLLAAGALDVWSTPATMKKGRPGHVVTVLSRPADADALSARLLAETGSLGARRYLVSRDIQTRSGGVVDLDGYPIRIKVGPDRAKAEFDDVAAAASALNRPLREVAAQAEFRWSRAQKELVAPTPPLASGLEDSAHQSAR